MISFIKKGIDTSDASATVNDVLYGKTAYANGEKIVGSMINNGDVTITPTTTQQNKEQGYYNSLIINGVDSSIDENIMPENIKSGVSILGQIGTFNGNVKLFETVEEMQADTTAQEGDLAIVYKKEKGNMTVNTQTQYITFPETVTLPEVITQEYNNCMLHSPEGDGRMLLISLSPTQFQAAGYTMAGMIIASYTSEDGINYTRTALGGTSGSGINPNIIDLPNPMDFGTLMYCDTPDLWNDNFGYFMQINGDFKGLYEYKIDTGYELVSAQLSLSNSNELLLGRIAYGKNGITFGTLKTLDTSDANATADDIVTSKTAYVNGQKITGSLPLFPNTSTFTVDNAGVTNNTEDSTLELTTINTLKQTLDSNLNMQFSAGYSEIATAIGLTAEKIVSGNVILGIEGTATTGTTPDTTIQNGDYGLEITTSGELDNDIGIKLFTNANTQSKLYEVGSIVEMHITNELLAQVLGITADKIKSGEVICGIEGTYTGNSSIVEEE